ncbi:MAG: hypothetical protein Q4C56_05505 [Peptococcaceae bacterium]|nr:hypothetical protein [Peptococcaceae bacterium]
MRAVVVNEGCEKGMMVEIVNAMGCLVEALTLYLLLDAFFAKKYDARWVYVTGFLLYGAFIEVCNLVAIGNTVGMIAGAVLVSHLFVGTMDNRLIAAVGWFGISAILELMITYFAKTMSGLTLAQMAADPALHITGIICAQIAGVLVFAAIYRKYSGTIIQGGGKTLVNYFEHFHHDAGHDLYHLLADGSNQQRPIRCPRFRCGGGCVLCIFGHAETLCIDARQAAAH